MAVSERTRRPPPRRTPGARPGPRVVALLALCAAAFGGGALVATRGGDEGLDLALRYAAAWERSDWDAMHRLIEPDARRRVPPRRFAALHAEAMTTATATGLRAGVPAEAPDDAVRLPVAVETRSFGTVRADVVLPVVEVDGERHIAWERALRFPGLRRDEDLSSDVRMPRRAALLARDGTALAEGPQRTPDAAVAETAASIVGQVGDAPAERRAELRRLGVPDGTPVGLTGLERVFDERLLGRPGGELRAGPRVLAAREPSPGRAVRTTIDLGVQRAAVAALGGRLGGVAAVRPRTGEVLALAGVAFSGLQPPGSTFKIVTLAAALEAGVTRTSERFPVETATTLEGVTLENSDGERCGGTLTYSFAHSCNTVFAPMGAELGAERLVRAAEAFGFNQDLGIPGAATSTIPPAGEIGDDLAVGSTAIGQGRLQATALQMTLVAATIARDGRLTMPLLDRDAAAEAPADAGPRAVSARTARIVQRMMREVVRSGTGAAAAIPGVAVSGKTGTAELRTTVRCRPEPSPAPPCPPEEPDDATDTSAWFAAYAPSSAPRVAVGVLLVAAGKGGETAAPAARLVLQAAL